MSIQTDTAYKYIKQRILEGVYKPSQKLVESELAETIGVSRNTIKKALLNLQQENLVVVEPNKGASVKAFTLDEVINYLEIREVLEGLVGKKAAQKLTDSELNDMNDILEKMYAHLKNNEFDEYSNLNKKFHNIVYNASGNPEAVEMIQTIRTQLIRLHFRTIMVPGRTEESYQDHKRILDALRSRDGQKAEEALRKHIANVRKTIELNYNYLL